jgi:antitoxin VapB
MIYTQSIYIKWDGGEETLKTARVFKSGNSQAVRLPKEFQLDVAEVQVFQKDGDLVLRPMRKTWQDYFDRGRRFSDDFPMTIEDLPIEEKIPW